MESQSRIPIVFPVGSCAKFLEEAEPVSIARVFNKIYLVSAVVASACLALQLIVITVNVIMRYGFDSGISWMEEISKDVLMTAFTSLSMAIGVKLNLHVNVDLIPKRAPAWVTPFLFKLKHVVVGLVGLALAYYGVLLVMGIKARIASIPILPAYLQFITMPLAGVLITYDSLIALLGVNRDDHSIDDLFMKAGTKNG
jgi:TRAP-type C4-dicarboxylate transport system permease small subunit